jgi:hypothetical protein
MDGDAQNPHFGGFINNETNSPAMGNVFCWGFNSQIHHSYPILTNKKSNGMILP